jgi:AraC family transcriptional regulator of adaptative response/methylated-DNA-[protein]-cysteine methyltransferase
LQARARFDGVYAVLSTGIVCRPGCPSRLPLRRNVVLFDNAGQAEAAGFRRCLRCGGGP